MQLFGVHDAGQVKQSPLKQFLSQAGPAQVGLVLDFLAAGPPGFPGLSLVVKLVEMQPFPILVIAAKVQVAELHVPVKHKLIS
jgi:hypothetical protein